MMIFSKLVLKKVISQKHYRQQEKIYLFLKTLLYFGNRVSCPMCLGRFRKFLPYNGRLGVQCPRCNSLERYRLLSLYLKDKTNFFRDNLKVLEIGPMDFFQRICKRNKNLKYISVDISSPIAMVKMDIMDMGLRDNQFDSIICYRVLEYVYDDEKALKELFRILKPGGWAILQSLVDRNRDTTFKVEIGSLFSSQQLERNFEPGYNMKRIYGCDYKDRIEKAGFKVKLDNYVVDLDTKTIKRYGLADNEIVYFCTKPETVTG
jgi:SAM-dependent methyltransferase